MFDENISLWYDESREAYDRYVLACDAKSALDELCRVFSTLEKYELTDEQFNKLPDKTFPEDWELDYMDCDELNSIIDDADDCIGIFLDILAEVTNH